jgi:hypothetical protein
LHVGASPDPPGFELGDGLREPDLSRQLIGALSADADEFPDFVEPGEVHRLVRLA